MSNAVSLPNRADVIDVIQGMTRLHLDDVTNGDRLCLWPARPLDEHVPSPPIRYPAHQLDDVTAVGAEQRQRWLDGPGGVIPTLHPRILRHIPIPLQAEHTLAVAQRGFDTHFPDVVTIDDVVDELANRPRVRALGQVELRFGQAGDGRLQLGRPVGIAGENGVWIARLLRHR
jgi:hypothetical protein